MNGKKVLIVANDFVTAEAFERSLLKAGCDVVRLNDATALAWLTHERADVIFLDDSLPDLSVAEVSHRLRDQPGTRLTPLVILMGRKGVGQGAKQSPASADLYVPRSLAPKTVVAVVRMLLADVPLMRRPNDPTSLDT